MKKISIGLICVVIIALCVFAFLKRNKIRKEYSDLQEITNNDGIFAVRFADADSRRISFYSDSLRIIGDLYESEIKNPRCILLLHGSYVLGRQKPVILSMAKSLHEMDYTVLTIDFRGFNDSQDPESINSLNDIDFAQDAISAVNYLINNTNIDTSRIYILGHSLGAGIALQVQKRDKRIKKIILIGPPRKIKGKILDEDSPFREELFGRFIINMEMEPVTDTNLLSKSYRLMNIKNYLDEFRSEDHIPILLIDGGNENVKDLNFLRSIYSRMTEPKEYWTIKNTNHYLNTGFFLGKPSYDVNILRKLADEIDSWLRTGNLIRRKIGYALK